MGIQTDKILKDIKNGAITDASINAIDSIDPGYAPKSQTISTQLFQAAANFRRLAGFTGRS